MPAVQPARLRQQAALLSQHFDDPPAFIRGLHHLLEFYADRTHRPGLSGAPPSLVEAYNVPAPVMRLLLQVFQPLAGEDPDQAARLCDTLWKQPYLEFRQLAAGILGNLPVEPPERVLNRIQLWAENAEDQRIVDLLLNTGAGQIRKRSPEVLVNFLEAWLNDAAETRQGLGLRMLSFLVSERAYENLPVFFRLMQPLVRETSPKLRFEVLDVMQALALRSPQETAFFLSQTLKVSHSPDTAWLIRQLYDVFPVDIQAQLKATVREINRAGY